MSGFAGGPRPRAARARGLWRSAPGERSRRRGAGRGFAPRRALLLPGALRACNSSSRPVCSLDPRVSRGGGRGEEGGCCPEPEGVEPSLSGELGRALPQVPTLGARGWSGGGRRRWSASPNPGFCARLLLEKAACLAGGGAPTPPLRPGLRARLEVSERGRDGGSRPSKGVGRGWGGGVGRLASVRVRGSQVAEARARGCPGWKCPELLRLPEWDHVQVGRAPLHLGVFLWNCLGAGRSRVHAALVWPAAVSRVSLGSLSRVPAAVRLGKGRARQYPARWPHARCLQCPWGTPGCCLPGLLCFWGKG